MSDCDYCKRAVCDCLKRAEFRYKYRHQSKSNPRFGDLIVRTSNKSPEPRLGKCWRKPAKLRNGGDQTVGLADDMGLIEDHTDSDAVVGMVQVEQFNSRRTDVCRLCGTELTPQQTDWCSPAHREMVRNARDRADRAAKRGEAWTTEGPAFSLDSITLAGVGEVNISPEAWNAIDKSEPPYVPGPKQPWFTQKFGVPARSRMLSAAEIFDGFQGHDADVRFVIGSRLTPRLVAAYLDAVDAEPDTRTLRERADRLVRRFGTGGTPQRCEREGCYEVPRRRARGLDRFCSPKCEDEAGSVTVSRLIWLNTITSEGVKLLPRRVAA